MDSVYPLFLLVLGLSSAEFARSDSEHLHKPLFTVDDSDNSGTPVSDQSVPKWALKLMKEFKALKLKVGAIDEEQRRMQEEEHRLAKIERVQSKLHTAIQRSEAVAVAEKSRSNQIHSWRYNQPHTRHNRHRNGGLNVANDTTTLTKSCPQIRTGPKMFLDPVFFSIGYYVDISIADDTGRKVRVGHTASQLFDLHSTMYLTDMNGQVGIMDCLDLV